MTQKLMITLLTIAFVAFLGVMLIRHQIREMFRLRAAWDTSSLHVYSAKDGPWVITHLVKLGSETNQYAVAQLPSPATIIDSRGEHFTTNFMQSLTWITLSGSTSAPPTFGDPMRAFYYVPEQTR
jgi:hypothetical protein